MKNNTWPADKMNKLLTAFEAFYSALYNDLISAPTASAEFDKLMRDDYSEFTAVLWDFAALRGDYVTSDREAAAFYLAYNALRGV